MRFDPLVTTHVDTSTHTLDPLITTHVYGRSRLAIVPVFSPQLLSVQDVALLRNVSVDNDLAAQSGVLYNGPGLTPFMGVSKSSINHFVVFEILFQALFSLKI